MKITIIPQAINEEPPWYFPAGAGYIAAALKKDHKLKIFELKIKPYTEEEIEEYIKTDDSEVYCIGGLATDYTFVKWIASIAKKYNKTTIIGGGIASAVPHLLIKDPNIDYLVIGEGDHTIQELIKALENKIPPDNVKGIQYRKFDGEIVKTPLREQCDIDELPMPAYELFPMQTYLNSNRFGPFPLPKPYMTMITSRGCPYQCTFCHKPIDGKARFRNADNVIKEMKYLVETYNLKGIFFQDDLFIADRKRVYELCDKIEEEKLEVKWFAHIRANLTDEALLKRMKKAGCVWVAAGIESANQKVLDLMKKQITVEQAHKLYELTNKVGLKFGGSFIIGMPGETEKSLKDLVNFCKKHSIYTGPASIATPLPGTELWNLAKEKGFITDENEEDFLSKLHDVKTFTVNFTDWSDEELLKKKEWVENETLKNYYKQHPLIFIKENVKSLIRIRWFIERYGYDHVKQVAKNKIKMFFELFKRDKE